jgi:hypothetical protein
MAVLVGKQTAVRHPLPVVQVAHLLAMGAATAALEDLPIIFIMEGAAAALVAILELAEAALLITAVQQRQPPGVVELAVVARQF